METSAPMIFGITVAVAGFAGLGYYMMSPSEENKVKPVNPYNDALGAKGSYGGSRRFKHKRNKSKRK